MIDRVIEKINFRSPLGIGWIVLVIAVLVYSHVCRTYQIYFFWESRFIGWSLIILTLFVLLIKEINFVKDKGGNPLFYKYGIGICSMFFVVGVIMWLVTPHTEVYQTSLKYIHKNEAIRSKVGEIQDVVLFPYGFFELESNSNQNKGSASLWFIVKGDKTFLDINIQSYTDWDDGAWIISKMDY